MAEYTNSTRQTLDPGESVIFTLAPVPCTRGFVRWRAGTGNFNLSGWVPRKSCNCNNNQNALYLVDFRANIAIPTGGTVGEISLGIALDGSTLQNTIMRVTPTAEEAFFNVSGATNIPIWRNCCQTVTVVNTSDTQVIVDSPNIIFSRPDLAVTY